VTPVRSRVAAAALVAAALTMAGPAAAHIGGDIVTPVFFTPAAGLVMVDGPMIVSWNDPDEDPTGVLHFYYTPDSIPPVGVLSSQYMVGAVEIGTQPVSQPEDAFEWDTAGLEPGVYSLFAVSKDPPLCDTATTSGTTLVVRGTGAGTITPLAGTWTNPTTTFSGTVSGMVNLRLEAISESEPKVTLVVGRTEPIIEGNPEEECAVVGEFHEKATLVTDLVGEHEPGMDNDRWGFRFFWDSDTLLPGPYVLRADFSNADGQTYSLYSPVQVPVEGRFGGPGPDADADAATDSGGGSPDASGAEIAADAGDGGLQQFAVQPSEGCSGSGAPATPWGLTLLMLAMAAAPAFRRWSRSPTHGGRRPRL